MTSLPDWLVERAALDEVPPAMRSRIAAADPQVLAERIAAMRAANAAELAHYPAGPAVAQIAARVATGRRQRTRRRRLVAAVAGTLAMLIVVVLALRGQRGTPAGVPDEEVTRAKGATRLVVYRNAGERAERLDEESLVHAGDALQIRYKAGGARHGVIASIDGNGVVTLHFPASEHDETALSARPTSLPDAYILDDAPRFERFFFVTADTPIDVGRTLAALRTFARRDDADTATPELSLRQWSLRLRKAEPPAPTP